MRLLIKVSNIREFELLVHVSSITSQPILKEIHRIELITLLNLGLISRTKKL